MRDAYRDDLAAAELRVRDLEREHTALVAHNTELEASAVQKPAAQPAPAPAKPRFRATPGEQAAMFTVMVVFTVIFIAAGGRARDFKGLAACVVLATQGLIRLRRHAVLPATEIEHQLEAPPAAPLGEEEANQARLADALKRERDEAAARENAARVEAEVRAIAKAHPPDKADRPRSIAMMFAVVGCIAAGAAGSLAGIGFVMVAAAGVLFVIDRRKAT